MNESDGPFWEIAKKCEALITEGSTIFQKFTCVACQARQTMPVPNALYRLGRCDQCGVTTNLEETGCGFMLVASSDPEAHVEIVAAIAETIANAPSPRRN